MTGTDDDFIARFEDGSLDRIEMPAEPILGKAAAHDRKTGHAKTTTARPPPIRSPTSATTRGTRRSNTKSSMPTRVRISSNGPDRKPSTQWDIGVTLTIARPAAADKPSWTDFLRPETPWLDRRREELGIATPPSTDSGTTYRPRLLVRWPQPARRRRLLPLLHLADARHRHRLRPLLHPLSDEDLPAGVITAWGGAEGIHQAATSVPFLLTRRPLPGRMPVVTWGVGGTDHVVREIPRLRDLGFTRCLDIASNDRAGVWEIRARELASGRTGTAYFTVK